MHHYQHPARSSNDSRHRVHGNPFVGSLEGSQAEKGIRRVSAPVPTGSIVTYHSEDWYAGYFTGASDLFGKVGQKLSADGLKLLNSEVTAVQGGILTEVEKYLGGPATLAVTLNVEVSGGLGYNSADDVVSIVDHEVYAVTGTLPSTSKATNLSLPGPGGTGPKVATQCGDGFIESLKGFFGLCDKPKQISKGFSFGSLGSSTVLYVGLAIFGFVAALALIGYSGALRRTV